MIGGIARNPQRTAESGEEDAKREHAGEQPLLIDAERRHHIAVLRRGADQHAPSGAAKQQPEDAENNRAEDDQEQVIGRHLLAEEIHRAAKARRAAAKQIVGAPDQDDEILDHQCQPECRKQLEQFGRPVDPPQQDHFDQHAERRDRKRRQHDAAPEPERTRQPLR